MSFYDRAIPAKARIIFSSVIAAGSSVLLFSLYAAFFTTDISWVFLALATAFSGIFTVRLPFVRGKNNSLTITVSDVFIFSGILLYSPDIAVVLSVLDGTLAAIRADRTKRPFRVLFNLSQLALSTWIVGQLFYALVGTSPPLAATLDVAHVTLFLNLGLCALVHFFLNSGLVSLALSLATGQRMGRIFSENLLWASLTNVAGAAGAAIIFLNFESTPFFAVAVTIPIILVIYYAYKMNLKRINSARHHLEELDELYDSTITSLAMAIDAKDHSSYGNIRQVRAMTIAVARKMGIHDDETLKGLRAAALLHDIGKLAVPEYILNKPGRLSEAEVAKVRDHPSVGADILETVPFPYPVVPFVRHHHERWDGTGYPEGLKGTDIPLGARILAVVDCYVGLRSDRPFRPKLSRELALNFIRQEGGTAFDPGVVQVFLENVSELESEAELEDPGSPVMLTERVASGLKTRVARDIERTVFHDIASTHKEMQAVYEISQNISRSLSVSQTLAYLSAKIKRFVPYSACAIYLVNSEDDRLLPHHVTGMYKEVLEGVEVTLGDGVTGWVAAHNKPLINAAPELDFPHLEVLRKAFSSCLAVPLSVESSVVGVITLYSDAPNNYQERHLRLMEAIAPHSAAGISNAIIYEETQEDAYTDPLTGLPNLRYFHVFLNEELKRAKRIGYPVSLLMMDLDGFKSVNDRYGHQNGDALLVEVGRLLRAQLRKSDTCLRYGGDEFLAILPGLDRGLGAQTAHRIQGAFGGKPLININGEDVGVGISIGVATFPGDGLEADVLVAKADHDMYRNKVDRAQQVGLRASVVMFQKKADLP